jgi:hypothetical protein
LKKSILLGTVLSLTGTVLVIIAVFAALQASNGLNSNDAAAVQNFASFLLNQIGPLFFAGLALLGTGVLILAVKFLIWISSSPKQVQA